MKEYETVYITKPDLTESQVSQINDRIKSTVEKHEGRFFYARNMGKRKLAYPIAKETKGIYYCVDYASAGNAVSEIERMFRLNENVIRFLTVAKSDKVDVEKRAAEIAARGEDAPQAVVEEDSAPEGKEQAASDEDRMEGRDLAGESEEKEMVNEEETSEKTE